MRFSRRAPASCPAERSSKKSGSRARQNGVEQKAQRRIWAGGFPRAETNWFLAGWGSEPPAPRLYLRQRKTQRQEEARDPLALPTGSLKGRQRRARGSRLGRAPPRIEGTEGFPPSRIIKKFISWRIG